MIRQRNSQRGASTEAARHCVLGARCCSYRWKCEEKIFLTRRVKIDARADQRPEIYNYCLALSLVLVFRHLGVLISLFKKASRPVGRQYSVEYIKYGFIPSLTNTQLPMCLLCGITLSNEAMKPSRLSEHLSKKHSDKARAEVSYFQSLKEKFEKRSTVTTMFKASQKLVDKGLEASYKLSLLIARSGKPYSIGEQLIKPAVGEVIKTVMGQDPYPVLSSIALSNDSVARRIDEMSSDVEDKLCCELRSTHFAIQLDESTLRDSEALLLCYVRFIRDQEMVEELLFARSLQTDTKGSSIFQTLEKYFTDKNIPMENILACATDGAPAMVGRQRGFIALLKNQVPSVFAIHCVVHRQHLVAKALSTRLHTSLQIVIKAVNKIKVSSLHDRLFRQLCQENDEPFERLLLHTEVRWLSKGTCLTRFHALFSTVVEFLSEIDTELSEKVNVIEHDVAYLADIFSILNDVNKQLQGDHMTLIKAKKVIGAFVTKATLHRETLGRRDMYHFPRLAKETAVSDEELLVYCNHLEKIRGDMEQRFRDMLELSVPAWVINPFKCDIRDVKRELQDEIINLWNDDEAKARFSQHEYGKFWILERGEYPAMWTEAELLLMAFPTSYLVERGFSAVMVLLTKYRNRLDITKRGDLRLYLTEMEPDVRNLAASHQAHPSH